MQMRMSVMLANGTRLFGKWADVTEEEYKQTLTDLYEQMTDVSKIKLHLADGSMMFLPTLAAQNAAIFIEEKNL